MAKLYHGYNVRQMQKEAFEFLVGEWIDDGLSKEQAQDVAKMQVYGCQKMGMRDLVELSEQEERR